MQPKSKEIDTYSKNDSSNITINNQIMSRNMNFRKKQKKEFEIFSLKTLHKN